MAVEQVFNAHTVWHSEVDPAASKVLAHRWPDVPNLGDITQVDWNAMKRASNRKLTSDQVASSVRMYDELGMSLAPIAEFYGVSRQAMWDLLRRRTTLRPQLRYGQDNHFWRGGPQSSGRVWDITEKAIQRGILVRPETCEACGGDGRAYRDGRSPIQAHHPDYNQPLEVMWLCQPCHHDWHRTNTAKAVEGGDANGSHADVDIICGGFP